MRTLVIHPRDRTTDFLKVIYEDLDCTVFNKKCYTNAELKKLKQIISEHDRIIMLGHGTSYGLLGFGRFFFLDPEVIELLKQKQDNVYIWCNADKYVERFALKGFSSGMIISEYGEALAYCIPTKGKEIEESNTLFSKSIKEVIKMPINEQVLTKSREIYELEGNPIVEFNRENLFIFS